MIVPYIEFIRDAYLIDGLPHFISLQYPSKHLINMGCIFGTRPSPKAQDTSSKNSMNRAINLRLQQPGQSKLATFVAAAKEKKGEK